MTNKIKIFPTLFVVSLTIGNNCFGSLLSNNSKLYPEYKNYEKGYESGINKGSKPSLWASTEEKEGYKAGLKEVNSSPNANPDFVDFQYKEEELKPLEKNWPSFEKMFDEALNGDPNAMFMVGLALLYGGNGMAINVSHANLMFANAASLGHAPSLDKIRGMYLEKPNEDISAFFLHQVYVNLVIAMGHTEYTEKYHKVRTVMIEKFGKAGELLGNEIERIAAEKLHTIHQNMDLKKSNKKSPNSELFITKIIDITTFDMKYDSQYWLTLAGLSEE